MVSKPVLVCRGVTLTEHTMMGCDQLKECVDMFEGDRAEQADVVQPDESGLDLGRRLSCRDRPAVALRGAGETAASSGRQFSLLHIPVSQGTLCWMST